MLKISNSKIKKYINIGFDIETFIDKTTNTQQFIFCSLYFSEAEYYVFESKKELFDFILKNPEKFRNSRIMATNLGFDFIGAFFGSDIFSKFQFIMRGSDFISAFSYIYDGKFNLKPEKNKRNIKIVFADTLNYFPGGVEAIGEIIKIPKMKEPEYMGKRRRETEQEKEYFYRYNINDSRITKLFSDFLQDVFNHLGAEMKLTTASTSMDLFRKKYLKENLWTPNIRDIELQHKAYYGGRTETYKRGKYKNEFASLQCYDFNSLYPSVMGANVFPHPNYGHRVKKMNINQIKNYEGCCYCEFYKENDGSYPLLPMKTAKEKKLIFPYGYIKGYYTFIEIREALKNNYVLTKLGAGIYYTKTIDLFSDFVDDVYRKRMEYKSQNSPMQIPCKIILNSLYGKFGQKHERMEIIHRDLLNDTHKNIFWFKNSDYCRVVSSTPPNKLTFNIPIISAYVTSYGRIKLFKDVAPIHNHVIAVDTDSIFTHLVLNNSEKLGDLKLEYSSHECYFVKPKMYAVCKNDGKLTIKFKGVGFKIKELDFFIQLLCSEKPEINYNKVASKFKESLIQGIPQMTASKVHKEFNIDDNKRDWLGNKFIISDMQESRALVVDINGKTIYDYAAEKIKEDKFYEKALIFNKKQNLKKSYIDKQTAGSDFFDSKGDDIDNDEFFENEKFFSLHD